MAATYSHQEAKSNWLRFRLLPPSCVTLPRDRGVRVVVVVVVVAGVVVCAPAIYLPTPDFCTVVVVVLGLLYH